MRTQTLAAELERNGLPSVVNDVRRLEGGTHPVYRVSTRGLWENRVYFWQLYLLLTDVNLFGSVYLGELDA